MNEKVKQIARQVGKKILDKGKDLLSADSLMATASSPTQPKKAILGDLAKGASNLLKEVAPDLIGMIPGIGPIAKVVLSTLNDDEWFGEFRAAGATFNEFLEVTDIDRAAFQGIAAVVTVPTEINTTGEFVDNFMPTVLAYVRDKTNNVLADDTSLYTEAFLVGSQMYALHYTLKKYVYLAENLPLNIPLLNQLLAPLNPISYSQFKGLQESLENYIKTTVKLPYAWTEYLRWRFGTVFCSDNTGHPGLVMYDAADLEFLSKGYTLPGDFLAELDLRINELLTAYKSAGRAGADIKIAYNDHQTRYDVEKMHYDEKEFNLRCNMYSETSKSPAEANNVLLYMDSRLDSSAAIQAVTLSCFTQYVPFKVHLPRVSFYLATPVEFGLDWEITSSTHKTFTCDPGWYTGRVSPGEVAGYFTPRILTRTQPTTSGVDCYAVIQYDSLAPDVLTKNIGRVTGEASATTLADREVPEIFADWLVGLIADSMQLHNYARVTYFGTYRSSNEENKYTIPFVSTMLAYDMAYVTKTQVESIQRTAMRNLIRGNYKAKTAAVQRPDVQTAVAEVEKAAITDVVANASAK